MCKPWTGTLNKDGYGVVDYGATTSPTGKAGQFKAHRVAFFLEHGWWPPVVMHRCDFPPCVELSHLAAGTVVENNADRLAKGRSRPPRAIDPCEVTMARCLREAGAHPFEVAIVLGVSVRSVQRALHRDRVGFIC